MKKIPAPAEEWLEAQRAAVSRCVRCGSCRSVCPSFLAKLDESQSARGRMALIEAVLNGKIAVSGIYEDRLAACTGCLACEDVCAAGVPVSGIIQSAREEAVRQCGTGFIETMIAAVFKNDFLVRSTSWLAPLALHYRPASTPGEKIHSKFKVRDSNKRTRADKKETVLFFAGCGINYYEPSIGSAAASVLDRIGCEVMVPEGLQCCGRPLLSLGDRRAAEELASRNSRIMSAAAADVIVTACASCSLTFKKEYPKLLGRGASVPQVLDIHEFLRGRITPDVLKEGARRKVTWHDPCHLDRGQGLAEAARELIGTIPGLKLIEMQSPDRCCGFGGVMRITNREISDRIADAKVSDITSTQATAVATGCPGCIMQIRDGLRRAGSEIQVLHTVQLLDRAFEENADSGSCVRRSDLPPRG